MSNSENHLFVTEMEGAGKGFSFTVDEKSLLLDIKALIKEYYAATFTVEENALMLAFNNGQKFKISVKKA